MLFRSSRDYLAALLASPPSPGNAERLDAVVADLTARWADRLGLAPDDPGAALAARSFYLCFVGCVFSVACEQMTRADAVGLLLALIDDRNGTRNAGGPAMTHVLVAIGSMGDLRPQLALARALRAEGADVSCSA